jgi:hypothetical protein
MSYEGYEVHYCERGHCIGLRDAHDYDEMDDCFCGSPLTYVDHVDQTNGCDMLPDGKHDPQCPEHRKELKLLDYTPVKCNCKDGYIIRPSLAKVDLCDVCDGNNPTCPDCFGTGSKMHVEEESKVVCPECKGRGIIFEERYDISPFVR